jgi:hypothetical protein
MTLKSYILGMWIIAILSLVAFGAVVILVDPMASGTLGITLFYLVAFFAFSSIFNISLIFLRRKFIGAEMAAANVGLSFRQGILMTFMVLGILILQNLRMLVWWDALLVVAGVFLIELYFLSKN